jgi:hypothetical protein
VVWFQPKEDGANAFNNCPWRIFRHRCRFSTIRTCLDSNARSILRQSFETRNESQDRQRYYPSQFPLSGSLTGSVANRLGTHPFLRLNPGSQESLFCSVFPEI